MTKIIFDDKGGVELVRAAFLARLKADPGWNVIMFGRDNLGDYIEYTGNPSAARTRADFLTGEVFWELVTQGVLSPGYNTANPNLPHFHTTEYGKRVLAADGPVPHDADGYLKKVQDENPSVDLTVLAYLQESIECFVRGNHVASVVLLGISSERVFLLLAESLRSALSDPGELKKFEKIMDRFGLKPKLDFTSAKIKALQEKRKCFPDNINIALCTVCDFIRLQRNDLGHPKETPPQVSREDAYINLRVFPRYYRMVEDVRTYLKNNRV